MAIREIPDGQDFQFDSDFGFHGGKPQDQGGMSARGKRNEGMQNSHMDRRAGAMTESADQPEGYSSGGRTIIHLPDGGKTITHPSGLREVLHADGGKTVHHLNGDIEHHDSSTMIGRMGMHDDGAQDAQMVKKGVHEHESHLHPGAPETEMSLDDGDGDEPAMARGGHIGQRPRFPSRAMKPAAEKFRSPMETPPRNPQKARTPDTSPMPGGQMAYGVQPSDEAGNNPVPQDQMMAAPSGGALGMPGMKRGGKMGRS